MTQDTDTIPDHISAWIDRTRYEETATFPVEQGYIWTSCASVENGNPLFWDDKVAAELTDGPIAPPTTLSLWFRPHAWEPDQAAPRQPLQVHFDLKEQLHLPEAVMTDSKVVFHEPVRPGDVISTAQVLRSVSPFKTTKLGTGRFWVIDVEYRNQQGTLVGTEIFTGFGYQRAETPSTTPQSATEPDEAWERGDTTAPPSVGDVRLDSVAPGHVLPTLDHPVTATTVVLGALATRDWRPMHHDVDFAVNRNGAKDIFLNTPNQQAWFERYVTDWTGPRGRLGRMRFRMHDSVYPGDLMRLSGVVDDVGTDESGCGWVDVTVALMAQTTKGDNTNPRRCTTCTLRVAVPTTDDDNPWARHGGDWHPA